MAPAAPAKEDQASGLGIGVIAVALVAGFALLPHLFPGHGSALVGRDAPALSLAMVANAPAGESSLSLDTLRGRPVLLDFWATWCGPCRKEVPVVDRIAQRYGSQGLTVIGVNTSDEAGNAAAFAKSHHLSFPIAYDEGQHVGSAFGVENLPTLVVISKEGKILSVRMGETSESDLDDMVKRAL